MVLLDQSDFNRVRSLIYRHAGIALRETRAEFLSRKILSRMKELDVEDVRDYLRYLYVDRTGDELAGLIEVIVNGETHFFRDYPQLKFFAEEILPKVVQEKENVRELSVLSAGCSTGDEPYTLAIVLREMIDDADAWALRLDGVDINRRYLQKAREGIYSEHELRDTPILYRNRYFSRRDDLYVLRDEVKEMVRFMHVNLFSTGQVSRLPHYDVVFCRNVLIYFDAQSAGTFMEHLRAVMNSGALIFFGHAESAGKVAGVFELVRVGGSFVYRK